MVERLSQRFRSAKEALTLVAGEVIAYKFFIAIEKCFKVFRKLHCRRMMNVCRTNEKKNIYIISTHQRNIKGQVNCFYQRADMTHSFIRLDRIAVEA